MGIPSKTKINHGTCNYEQVLIFWNFAFPIYRCFSFRLTCKPCRTFCQIYMVECVIHNHIADVLKSDWKKWIALAASSCILVPFARYWCSKKCSQRSSKILTYIFPVKTKWNIVCEYWKTNSFSRETNIFSQMHWPSNIFGPSATTIGGFELSLNYPPILNLKITVCLKEVWIWDR